MDPGHSFLAALESEFRDDEAEAAFRPTITPPAPLDSAA
jgi:hypothetical protein